jgi:ABC-type nitrate/sulfonate/bicarbonate transport system substrate-binding protein
MEEGMTRRACAVVLGVLAVLAMGAPGWAAEADVTIRVSGQPPMPLAQWFIADKLGFFKDNGLKVTFTKFFPSGAPQVEAGFRGEWDFGIMGGPPAITGGSRWGMLTVGLLAQEAGTHRMYVRREDNVDPKNPAPALRGKNVLVTLGSTGHMMLEACLKRWGLTPDDVKLVPLDPPSVVAAFRRGEGVLAQAYPPSSFQLERAGFVSICDTANLGVKVYPVVAAHPKFVKEHPQAAARFVEAIFRANEKIRNEPDSVVPLIFQFFEQAGVKETEDNVRLQIKQLQWLSLEEVDRAMGAGEAKAALEHMGQFFVRTGLLQKAPTVDFLAPQVVKDALAYRRSRK